MVDIFRYGVSYAGSSGLGLFLARRVILAHQGTITSIAHNSDSVYRGACFEISLPIEQKDSAIHYLNDF